jgi:hypothetical protein
MNFEQWLEENQYDVDFGNDMIDLMKKAYTAGLETAYDIVNEDEFGDLDYVMWRMKNLIKESK